MATPEEQIAVPGLHEETDVLQFRDPDQPNLHLVYWTRAALAEKPSPCLLIINHGLGEHSGRYRNLVTALLAAVPSLDAVISYDMRNHGRSDGPRGSTRTIDQYVNDLHDHVLPRVCLHYGPDAKVVLFGHSLGGAVIAACAARRDCLEAEGCGTVKGVVLSAPCLEACVKGAVNRALQPFAGFLVKLPGVKGMTKGSGLDVNMLCRDKKVVEDYLKDELTYDAISVGVATECLSYADKIVEKVKAEDDIVLNSVPTLVLHGTGDEIVKIDGSRKLVTAMQAKGKASVKMVEVDGAFHEIHNELPEMGSKQFVDSVSEFLSSTFTA